MVARAKSNEIKIVRLYDAPVEVVWNAWTDVEQVKKWWGPRGFTLTSHSKDLRPGGIWHYTMHGPDGTDWPNKTLYHEVVEHAKLVYDHGGNDEQKPLFRVTALFEQVGEQTRLEMTMTLPTPEAAEETRKMIKQAGGNSTWDRLAEYLEKESTGKENFVINRAFDVPIDVMFRMWTDPEHFAKWLPPTGFEMKFLQADIRPGGSTLFEMSNASGLTMYGRAEYLKIEQPHTIVYSQQFCDADGKLSRHPMAPTWPATMLTHVTFAEEGTEEGSERTRVTISWRPFGATVHEEATHEELKTFIEGRAGMTIGWTGSFDKLEAYLETV
jgi:uncharacterized protein YndB with AHSA1/START domain